MVSASEIRKLAERLAKAEALVQSGAVFPVSGLLGYAVVRNGDGNSMYLVRFETGKEHCTCPDFEHRQGKAGQPCKHILAASLGASSEAPTTSKTESARIDVAAEVKRLKGERSLALLNGVDDTVDAIDLQLAFYGAA